MQEDADASVARVRVECRDGGAGGDVGGFGASGSVGRRRKKNGIGEGYGSSSPFCNNARGIPFGIAVRCANDCLAHVCIGHQKIAFVTLVEASWEGC